MSTLFPKELLLELFVHLSPLDLLSVRRSSVLCRDIVQSSDFWFQKYERDFRTIDWVAFVECTYMFFFLFRYREERFDNILEHYNHLNNALKQGKEMMNIFCKTSSKISLKLKNIRPYTTLHNCLIRAGATPETKVDIAVMADDRDAVVTIINNNAMYFLFELPENYSLKMEHEFPIKYQVEYEDVLSVYVAYCHKKTSYFGD